MGSSLTQGFNYVRLGSHTLTAAAGVIDVQNIPSGYKFLVCYINATSTAGAGVMQLTLNGDVGANQYISQYIKQVAGVTSGAQEQTTYARIMDSVTDLPLSLILNINQTSTAAGLKGFHAEGGKGEVIFHTTGLWISAAEVNRITLTASLGTYDAGSELIVYGVR